MPTLDRITVYPVKSLDGMEVVESNVLESGALEHDRRWRLVDMDGRVINAKRSAVLHAIRAEFALDERLVTLWIDPAAIAARALPAADLDRLRGLAGFSGGEYPGGEHLRGRHAAGRAVRDSFHLVPGQGGPCEWLSEAFGQGVLLQERVAGGFPDDRDAAGPTLVATSSLVEVARWFGFDLAESRRRFRANLEVGGCDAFWEDSLASPARPGLQPSLLELSADGLSGLPVDPYADLPPPEPREFSIGYARFIAINVCRRCVVPTRDSRTGAVSEHFRDAFEARRGRGLRGDVDASGWGSLYRLGVNTRIASQAGIMTLRPPQEVNVS